MTVATEPALRPLSYFARQIPGESGAAHCNPATLGRWVRRGITLPDGRIIRLKAMRVGRKWLSRDDWFKQFCDDLAAPYQADGPILRTPAQRRKAIEVADKQLSEMGV